MIGAARDGAERPAVAIVECGVGHHLRVVEMFLNPKVDLLNLVRKQRRR